MMLTKLLPNSLLQILFSFFQIKDVCSLCCAIAFAEKKLQLAANIRNNILRHMCSYDDKEYNVVDICECMSVCNSFNLMNGLLQVKIFA